MSFIQKQQEKSLGELLVQSGRLQRDQLQKALGEQQRSAEPLGKTLVRLGYVNEHDVLNALQGLLVVTFRLAREDFAFEALFVREIIRHQEINQLPKMPPFIEGLIKYRGIVVPIMNLAAKLQQASQTLSDESRIIVVECASQIFGLLVDEVEAVVQLPMDRIESSPAVLRGLDARYIYGVGKYNDRLITVLHLENILENVQAHDVLPDAGELQ
ncbi:chemotaxis protein CheW [bacterium]|nr:chemotaxis protein CheW [bacterium]